MFGNCAIIAIIMMVAKLHRNRGNGVILFFQGTALQKSYWVISSGKKERKGTPDGKNIMDKDTVI